MLGDLPLQFDRPGWLLLLVLIGPALVLTWRSLSSQSHVKAWLTFAVRAIVLVMLTAALARPVWEKRGEGLTVVVILDRSQSVPVPLKRFSLQYLEQATDPARREADDRLAVITVARDPLIVAMPDRYTSMTAVQEPAVLTATDLEAGVNLALAVMPRDTANRIVLASDGNETSGSVLAAAELALANDVPIDVLVLEYEHADEVIFERIAVPSQARLGQTANVKLVLRSQSPATGRITLQMNDEIVDLNGDEEGSALAVVLDPGLTVVPITVSLDSPGPVQFDAVFEADDPEYDHIGTNNSAVAVTFVGSEGKILVIDDGTTESQYLVAALREADVAVDVRDTSALGRGPVFLSGYDAIVLANIPRYALTDEEDRTLHAYVHDLGGGLVMLGGPLSFGAGGWIDSQVARVLPVKLDPPQTRQMQRGALTLIMHSTEMPQGNFWGQKVAIAAIEALSRLDYVGIISFDWASGGSAWEFGANGPVLAGDKKGAIDAAKKMAMGDMPDFGSSMQLALNGLTPLAAGQKHVIIISDGDPQPPAKGLLDAYVAAGISITTVLIAGHGSAFDQKVMKDIAAFTGGRFYGPIKNPKQLPKIFIKEAQLVSRSLIVEGETYQPVVASRLPGPVEGFASVPPIDGYVLVAPREGLAQVPIINATTEGNDPIYAHWNYGLGKSIAFMSDLTGRWGPRWASWAAFKAFWEQSIRWVMRPSAPPNMIVNTSLDGDLASVDLEAMAADASFVNFLRTSAVVLRPDTTTEPLVLQQTGPGRYHGEFRTDQEGAYLVNINFVGAGGESPIEGNIQAAVSVPYPREFRDVTHNGALLAQVADLTGGRMLSATDPALVDLFYRGDLEVPRSPRSIWDLLAILAAALFVLDVAARRIAVDRRALAAAAGRAVGRRAEVGTETVAAWKRIAGRKRPATGTKFEATAEDLEQAIDVGEESAADRRAPARQVDAPAPEPEPGADEGDYTSRLLAAKRRAREQRRGEPGEGGGDG